MMRKKISKVICFLLCLCCAFPIGQTVWATVSQPEFMDFIKIRVNSREVDTIPLVYNQSIYLKISDLAPWIDMNASYDVGTTTLFLDDYANSDAFNEAPIISFGDSSAWMRSFNIFAKWLHYTSGISDYTVAGFEEFKQFVIEQLIEAAAVYRVARANGIEMKSANYAELNEQVNQIEAGFGSKQDFYSFLQNEVGISYLSYYCIQEYYYLREMVSEKLVGGTTATESLCIDYYNNYREQFRQDNVQVKHILFKTTDEYGTILPYTLKKEVEQEALSVLESLQNKEYTFDQAMQLFSEDTATSSQTTGFISTFDNVQPEFWSGVANAEEGVLATLIETKYGYHIVEVIRHRDTLPYSHVKPEIELIVKTNEFAKILQEMIGQMQITVNEELLENYYLY